MTKVSVIVTFFDEYAYLHKAIYSVVSQYIREYLEIIIVVDNPMVIKTYLEQVSDFHINIKIIYNEQNWGLSKSRNIGINNSTGDYILFLDSDDYLISGTLQHLIEHAVINEHDMTHGNCMASYGNGLNKTNFKLLSRDKIFFRRKLEHTDIHSQPFFQFISHSWKCIYKRDFLQREKLYFDEAQKKFEDRLFVLSSITKAKSVGSLPLVYRVWRQRNNSISNSYKTLNDMHLMIDLIFKCLDIFEKNSVVDNKNKLFLMREECLSFRRLYLDTPILKTVSRNPEEDKSLTQKVLNLSNKIRPEIFLQNDYYMHFLMKPKGYKKPFKRSNTQQIIELLTLIQHAKWEQIYNKISDN